MGAKGMLRETPVVRAAALSRAWESPSLATLPSQSYAYASRMAPPLCGIDETYTVPRGGSGHPES